jgi:hypothetical protein
MNLFHTFAAHCIMFLGKSKKLHNNCFMTIRVSEVNKTDPGKSGLA